AIGGGFTDAPLGVIDGKPRIGNWTPYAEFNILVDPEAASELFSNKELAPKTTLIPLDLTHQVLATAEVRQTLLYGKDGEQAGPGKTTLRTMLVELLYFFAKGYADKFGITEGPPLHDPLAAAAVLIGTPEEIPFFDWDVAKSTAPENRERFEVTVVTEGTFEEAQVKETGRTIAKLLPAGSEGIRIPRSCDVKKFWEVIEECVERADEANKALGR
ncbi:unnamed protein product, partial [Clonostachys rosea]